VKQNGARPYDGHLLRAIERRRLDVNLARQVAEICREIDKPLPSRGATAGGDPARLRGIPCAGFGGAVRGTRPTDSIYGMDREASWLAVLSQNIDGTSPGSQPEEELLRKYGASGAA